MKKIAFMMLAFSLVNSSSSAMLALLAPSDDRTTPATIEISQPAGGVTIYREWPWTATPCIDHFASIPLIWCEHTCSREFQGSVLKDLFRMWKTEYKECFDILTQLYQGKEPTGISSVHITVWPDIVQLLTTPGCIDSSFVVGLAIISGYQHLAGPTTYTVKLTVTKVGPRVESMAPVETLSHDVPAEPGACWL